jgi:hypothetical protein
MSKFVKSLSALVFCTALFSLSPSTHALSFIQFGDIEQTQSWRLPTSIFETAGFDAIEAFIVSSGGGGPFENPGFSLFNNASWSGTLVNPTYTAATGDNVVNLDFSLNFDGDLRDPTQTDPRLSTPLPVVFDILFHNGGVEGAVVSSFRLTFNGANNLAIPSFIPAGVVYDRADPPAPTAVPDTGSTLGLLGLSLAGLAGLRRKLRLS